MKRIISLALCLLVFNPLVFGKYELLSKEKKILLEVIVQKLGVSDVNNSVKGKIYDMFSFAFDGPWCSCFNKLDDLLSSRYKGKHSKGIIEVGINNAKNGIVFLTFIYNSNVNQIIILSKHVKHGSDKLVVKKYEERVMGRTCGYA